MWEELYRLRGIVDTLHKRIAWLEESFDERTSAYRDLIEYLRSDKLKSFETIDKTECIQKTATTRFQPQSYFEKK